MTTIMSTGNSEGITGRCDARCHEAEGDECDCICGGRYHGVGSRRATERLTEDLLGNGSPLSEKQIAATKLAMGQRRNRRQAPELAAAVRGLRQERLV